MREQTEAPKDAYGAELDRLEREVKFSDDPDIRRGARRRYIELTDKDCKQ